MCIDHIFKNRIVREQMSQTTIHYLLAQGNEFWMSDENHCDATSLYAVEPKYCVELMKRIRFKSTNTNKEVVEEIHEADPDF